MYTITKDMNTLKLKAEDPILDKEYDKSVFEESNFIENLQSILTNNIAPPYSISLNGNWGIGKTTILKTLEYELMKDNKFEVLWFNPWEYERSNDVVLVLLQQLSNLAKSKYADILKSLSIFGTALLAGAVDTAARFITQGNLSFENIQKIHELVEKESLNKYDSYSSFVDEIKEDFKKLTNQISKKKEGNPLIIILDDLDRCLPENALELIESLKNIFIIPDAKVIFIAGIDTNIAKRFIQSKYNKLPEEFAYNYFKKVFNSTINVPYFNELQIENLVNNEISKGLIASISDEEKVYISKAFISVELKSLRSVHNIFSNMFLHKKLHVGCELNKNQLIILYLFKEVWQSEYDSFLVACRKNLNEDIGRVIKESMGIEKLEENNPKLYQFITTYLTELFNNTKSSQIFY